MWLLTNTSSIILLLGSLSGCIAGLCYQMRHSRCENISICWGACKCDRKIMTQEEQDEDDIRNKTQPRMAQSHPTAPPSPTSI